MMPFVAMRASVRDVLPWSCHIQQTTVKPLQSTHHMGHDAYVAHIVG
jgi:hypothetical protein